MYCWYIDIAEAEQSLPLSYVPCLCECPVAYNYGHGPVDQQHVHVVQSQVVQTLPAPHLHQLPPVECAPQLLTTNVYV